ALASFGLAIAGVLVAAHALFGLGRFKSMSRGGFERQWGRVYDPLAGTEEFCARITGTAASVRNGVCAVLDSRSAVAEPVFYALLSAFVVLLTLSSRVTGRDIWFFYLAHGIYVYGEILLFGLLLVEYRRLLTSVQQA